jgi:hypothetical protein
LAYINNAWHSLTCIPLSTRAITDRHNEVLNRLGESCRLIHLYPHLEPAGLDKESEKRPDLQVALPDTTILSDVTIIHPSCKTWRKVVIRKDIVAAGDQKEAMKDKTYQPMAQALDMEFCACVLDTYGGFHRSALTLINKLTCAVDPATSLISPADFKNKLKREISIAVQRGNADIMIQASQRHRQEVIKRSSYRYASRRQRETHQNTTLSSAPTRAANTGGMRNIVEEDIKTHTPTTEETTVIVIPPSTTLLPTPVTNMEDIVEECKQGGLSSTRSHTAAVNELITELCQQMDEGPRQRGRRRQEDIEMEEIAEMGCMGAGDSETRERLVEEVDRIVPP